jgi:hypothetical protein
MKFERNSSCRELDSHLRGINMRLYFVNYKQIATYVALLSTRLLVKTANNGVSPPKKLLTIPQRSVYLYLVYL